MESPRPDPSSLVWSSKLLHHREAMLERDVLEHQAIQSNLLSIKPTKRGFVFVTDVRFTKLVYRVLRNPSISSSSLDFA